ncbi:hypothetical protein JI752_006810 [Lysobacter sp. MMG2]|uniref:pYEATS domain-containing protein n=1 Tax=Lysobacter sp. MMG2 TaxID=2801338 RepID=UPI001C21DDB9|nr:pYEATS domain-containing protein [Lysobacter sp. MMG2]MBU8975850.1 hypothetical protein [Lysobacter sp. MMG2]
MSTPVIKASFVLDADGKPRGRSTGNYEILLQVDGAPEDAYRVVYELDDSYYDPRREATDPSTLFSEELTSYGDYVIQARVRTTDHTVLAKRSLFEALKEAHAGNNHPAILKALHDIQQN